MLLENIKEAFHNLSNNKMRSLLTMLGIIIGISAVITITTIGSSIRSTLSATMNSLAGNRIEAYLEPVFPEDIDYDTFVYPEMTKDDYISQEMLDGLKETYPDEVIGFAMNETLGNGRVYENSKHYANVNVSGVTPETLKYMNINIISGRNISDQDNKRAKNVCVVSDRFVHSYFGRKNPIGEIIEYNNSDGRTYQYAVIGVYEYKESIFGKPDTTIPEKDRSTSIFIPVNTIFSYSNSDISGYPYAEILLNNTVDATIAEEHIKEYFDNIYSKNSKWQIWTYNLSSELGIIDTVINVVTIAISFIAAISLIVGGVGVMNIMLVSITERTREIGIRKALGARNKTIRQQFLIESIVLCLIGGIIGILLGLFMGFAIGKIAMLVVSKYYTEYAELIIMNVRPSFIAIALSVVFSMIIGVFFGSYPAKKASEMEVIDALGYE